MIPYGHQSINDQDIREVDAVLKSDWMTQGPMIDQFEKALAEYCGARYAVVTANGTAALHAAYYAAQLTVGDEFITSAMTFAATSNAGIWQGAKPVFADIDPITGNIDPSAIDGLLSSKTKAVVPIDYSGRPADLDRIGASAKKYGCVVIEDACHALGARYKGNMIGSMSDMTVFSFHPVKIITTGEGGAITTNSKTYYDRMKSFVSHGISRNEEMQKKHGGWYYEMNDLGQNYRLTDFQCALGISQLRRINTFLDRRRTIAKRYDEALSDIVEIDLPPMDDAIYCSSWHLYVIRLKENTSVTRRKLYEYLRENGIGVQVHYIPVYRHPYYQQHGYLQNYCPRTDQFYESVLSLPMYPDLNDNEQDRVVSTIRNFFHKQ